MLQNKHLERSRVPNQSSLLLRQDYITASLRSAVMRQRWSEEGVARKRELVGNTLIEGSL